MSVNLVTILVRLVNRNLIIIIFFIIRMIGEAKKAVAHVKNPLLESQLIKLDLVFANQDILMII